ncbi:MAG: hypothetical protein ACR2I8_06590, partial [Steroidobacteraceae bacterium]
MTDRTIAHPHWIRLGFISLLALFYVDGFLRGATPLGIVVFGLCTVPLLVGLWQTAQDLSGPRVPDWPDAIASALAACVVAFLVRRWHIEPVLAAAAVGVLGALPSLPAAMRSY